MKSKEQRKPNPLLREQRLLRGWSLQRVVDELCALSSASDERLPGVNAIMVSNWETGTKKPGPFYRERLCKLYNMTADRLGFMDGPILQHTNQPVSVAPVLAANNGHYHARQTRVLLPVGTTPSASVIPHERIKAIDFLSDGIEHTLDEQMSAWLTLGANHLSMLLDAGWSSEQVLDSLPVVLLGLQGLPRINRRKMLELGTAALVSKIPLSSSSQIIESERLRITEALGKSIGDGWKLFQRAGNTQVLIVVNIQKYLMQQVHALLYPGIQSLYYSGIYRLMGAALYFQERFEEAQYAQNCAYTAALESADTWNMAQSRTWQAYGYQALGQHDSAIQTIASALHLITIQDDEASRCLHSHLLACWAESATALRDYRTAQEKLEASENLVAAIKPNEEFDYSHWLQVAGNCAQLRGDYTTAIRYYKQALTNLDPCWLMRNSITTMPLAAVYARIGEYEASLDVAMKATSLISRFNAPIMVRQLIAYLQHDLLGHYSDDASIRSFIEIAQRQIPQIISMMT